MTDTLPVQNSWRRHLWWQLLLLGIVGTIGYGVSHRLDEETSKFLPETVVNCSTHNTQGSGYKALMELAQSTGLDCQRFEKSYRELNSEKGVLVVVAPNIPMMGYEVDKVLDWVASGNNLVYLDYCMYGSGKHLLDKLDLTANVSHSLEDWADNDLPDLKVMEHVSQLVLSSETRLKGGNELVRDKHGALIVQVRYGKGSCLIATLPNICANRRISVKSNWGNFQFLVNWLKSCGGRVLFDERVHGYTSSQNLFAYVLRGPLGPALLQSLVIFLVAVGSLNQRFGPAKTLAVKRKIAASEFIDGMALTYKKARAYDAAWSILYGSFLTRLCKALSMSQQEDPQSIAAAWSQAAHLKLEETSELLRKAETLQNSKIATEEELVNNIKECDRLYEQSKTYLAIQPGRRLGG